MIGSSLCVDLSGLLGAGVRISLKSMWTDMPINSLACLCCVGLMLLLIVLQSLINHSHNQLAISTGLRVCLFELLVVGFPVDLG